MKKNRIVIAVSGASGSILAKSIINRLSKNDVLKQIADVGIIFSETAIKIWEYELGNFSENVTNFKIYSNKSFFAPFASGSAGFDAMVIIPCSMGMLGRIASGISNDLISRTADVMIKERKKLILVTREAPLSLIHIKNMETVTKAGGIIFPASLAYYLKINDIESLSNLMSERILELVGFSIETKRWG